VAEDITVNLNIDFDRLEAVLTNSLSAALIKAAPSIGYQLSMFAPAPSIEGIPDGEIADGFDPDEIIKISHTPLDDTPGEHHIEFVSRHSIAEEGLRCPTCKSFAARRGDYSRVQKGILNEGEPGETINELIICPNVFKNKDGFDIKCNTFLLASPDTEHGDHLDPEYCGEGEDDVPMSKETPKQFYLFKRIGKDTAAREEYGDDVSIKNDGSIHADSSKAAEKLHVEQDIEQTFKETVPGYGDTIDGES